MRMLDRIMDDDISDENLMLSYRNGDADAFEVLYQRHKGPLYRFILRQSNVSDQHQNKYD